MDEYREQMLTHSDEDMKMVEQIMADEQENGILIGDSNTKCVFLYDIRTIEQMLLKGVECYEKVM